MPTCNKKYGKLAVKRLESQGIPYLLQPTYATIIGVKCRT